nr:rod shape-determining protein MreD [Mangrovactinospora gilvigrisea]
MKQIPLCAAALIAALLVEVTILARLHLPGAVPDLVLVVVVGLALVYGPRAGCLLGFCGGLLVDLAPPSDHAAGRYALVLTVVGYAVGLIRREAGQLRSALGGLLAVAAATVCGTLLFAVVGQITGDNGTGHLPLSELTITALIYNVLMAPFVVPAVMALARRTVSDPVARTLGGSAESAGAGGGGGPAAASGFAMPRIRAPRSGARLGRRGGSVKLKGGYRR